MRGGGASGRPFSGICWVLESPQNRRGFRGKENPARPKPRGVYSKIPRPLGRGRGMNESLSLALGAIGVCDVNHVHHLRAARLDGLQVGGRIGRISLALG